MLLQAKIVLAIAVLVLCCLSFETVVSNPVDSSGTSEIALNRTRRSRETHGCHKGYCWSYCSSLGFDHGYSDEWCYTTEGSSQSYNYVKCDYNTQCLEDWKCGGPCTL